MNEKIIHLGNENNSQILIFEKSALLTTFSADSATSYSLKYSFLISV